MTDDTPQPDTLTEEEILEKVENFLGFKFDKIGRHAEVVNDHSNLKLVTVETPAGRNKDAETFRVNVCPVCGETQPANWEAYRKSRPKEAKNWLKEKRERQARDYIEHGERPLSDDVLTNKIENKIASWDNNRCEQRHPPQRV